MLEKEYNALVNVEDVFNYILEVSLSSFLKI